MKNTKKRGGSRPNAGRSLKSPTEGKRRRLPMNFSPSNFEFLEKMGPKKHDYINFLLKQVREKILDEQ